MRSLLISIVPRETRRSAALLLAVALVASTGTAAPARSSTNRADLQAAPSTQPTEARYWLRVTASRVNVRSRADLNSRIVGRADRDDVLEAVGSEYGWHRIVPPAGVFSLVSAQYIERVDDQLGIVKVDTTLRVRIGSDIMPRDPMLSEVQTRLERDAEVRIIGQLNPDWLKIVPPEGVYVYISGDYVEQVSAEVAARLRAAQPVADSQPTVAVASKPRAPAPTKPTGQPDLTGRYGKMLKKELAKVEQIRAQLTETRAEDRQTAPEQPWSEILRGLQPIAKQRQEPQVAKLAAAWIEKLEKWKREAAAWRAAREIARKAERDKARHTRELEEIRRAQGRLTPRPQFDARGVLRPSFALRAGPYGMRYSLQDPFTHEVRAYVEFPTELDVDVGACIGKYVGVRGEKQSEEAVSVSVLRVTHVTVLNPDRPESPPTRQEP